MVPSSPRESVLKFFEEKYGNAPEYLVRAPGRVNLIGAPSLSAIADIIKIAARLGTKTKVLNCNIIVSSDTVRHAGLIPDLALEHQVDVPM